MIILLFPIFALLIVGCGHQRPEQTYDELLNDVVQNFNKGTTGVDSIINAFVKKFPTYDALLNDDSFMTVTVMKKDVMLALIYDYLDAGQFDNVQHLYNKMLEYAETEYGKVCLMKAMIYFEKAHLYEQTGDLDNAIKMMQKSAEVFKKLPKGSINFYIDAKEFIRRWEELKQVVNNTFSFSYKQPINGYNVFGAATENLELDCYVLTLPFAILIWGKNFQYMEAEHLGA